jgi:hypothetical protein
VAVTITLQQTAHCVSEIVRQLINWRWSATPRAAGGDCHIEAQECSSSSNGCAAASAADATAGKAITLVVQELLTVTDSH